MPLLLLIEEIINLLNGNVIEQRVKLWQVEMNVNIKQIFYNQLSCPTFVFINDSYSLYVSDGNHH